MIIWKYLTLKFSLRSYLKSTQYRRSWSLGITCENHTKVCHNVGIENRRGKLRCFCLYWDMLIWWLPYCGDLCYPCFSVSTIFLSYWWRFKYCNDFIYNYSFLIPMYYFVHFRPIQNWRSTNSYMKRPKNS